MILKLLTLLAVVGIAWMLIARLSGPRIRKREDTPPKLMRTQQLVKCRKCGIYLPAGQTCDCSNRA